MTVNIRRAYLRPMICTKPVAGHMHSLALSPESVSAHPQVFSFGKLEIDKSIGFMPQNEIAFHHWIKS